jgi:hypothetical protein
MKTEKLGAILKFFLSRRDRKFTATFCAAIGDR